MRALRLVALSDDGKSLILTVESPELGEEAERFELPIDERVRAAARGDARLGQIEDVGNTLPPRIIQARIRAGETPEQVASASGTRVERIMRFAHPVLQERARVAEQAREARVRLSDGSAPAPLEQFMSQRLRLLGGETEAVRWDAYKGDDGVWVVTAAWRAGHKAGTARWSYDIPARVVTPLDAATTDFAEDTRLVRVVPDVPAGAAVPERGRSVAVLRENVRHDSAPVAAVAGLDGADVDERGQDFSGQDFSGRDLGNADGGRPDPDGDPAPGRPVDEQAYLDEIADHDTVVLGRNEETEDPRARIPAWEDIVFGVRRNR